MTGRPIEILLVEDSPSDAQSTAEALREAKLRNKLSTIENGVHALQFLRRQGQYANAPRPDIILLDLNLPGKDGREVLAEIKADKTLASIPVVVLTTSTGEQDMLRAQELQVNSYINKPVEFMQFLDVLRKVSSSYRFVVTLPPFPDSGDTD